MAHCRINSSMSLVTVNSRIVETQQHFLCRHWNHNSGCNMDILWFLECSIISFSYRVLYYQRFSDRFRYNRIHGQENVCHHVFGMRLQPCGNKTPELYPSSIALSQIFQKWSKYPNYQQNKTDGLDVTTEEQIQ